MSEFEQKIGNVVIGSVIIGTCIYFAFTGIEIVYNEIICRDRKDLQTHNWVDQNKK